jgi:Flp pilus assembly protein TadG
MTRFRVFRDEDGSALLETTLTLSIVLLVIFGIMEFSRVLYADLFITYAAHSATRYAMVRGSSWSPTHCSILITANCTAAASDVSSFVNSIAPMGINTSSNLAISSTWPGTSASGGTCAAGGATASPGCVVHVQITYNFQFALPFISSGPLLLRSDSAVTISQ